MLTLLLAAALTAANPSPTVPPHKVSTAERQRNLAQDATLVCEARFIESIKIEREKLDADHQPHVIDIYAEKKGLTPQEKTLLTSYCNMFERGMAFAIVLAQPEDDGIVHQGLDTPTKHIAQFTH